MKLKDSWTLLPVIALVGGAILYRELKTTHVPRTPAQKNGIDTVYTEDSVYVIKFSITDRYERIKTEYDGGPEDLRP